MKKQIVTFEELSDKMKTFQLSNYQALICKNMKRIRKELYDENKTYYRENGMKNPYSAQSIAELLGISYEYYKRLESYDKTKPISIKLFFKIIVLFDKDIEEFFR